MDASVANGVRAGLRLAAAHHPLCSAYGNDVVLLGRLAVCGGCLMAVPAFFAGIMAAWALGDGLRPGLLVALGLAMGLPHLATYLRRRSVPFRRASKALGGLGLGIFMASLDLLWPTRTWQVALLAAMAAAFVALQGLRAARMVATCKRCPWAMGWAVCPGFSAGSGARPKRSA